MPLPDLIEIVPLQKPVHAEITVPGSKSITNRALILAALAGGETTLTGALWSEDTQVMVECLQELGFMVNVAPDPEEACNRTITVYGQGGKVPRGGTEAQPLELFVGNAGTAARFLAAMVCLGDGVYRLHGVPRMHERPQAALFAALRQLGYRVESEQGNDKLPVRIHGGGAKPGAKCRVSIEASSQFASALLLSATVGKWAVEIVGENAEESPYVAMTSELIKAFPQGGGTFQIEPDASSGSYFWGAGWLLPRIESQEAYATAKAKAEMAGIAFPPKGGMSLGVRPSQVGVRFWPTSKWQIDADLVELISAPSPITKPQQGRTFVSFPSEFSREHDLADAIMTVIALAPVESKETRFTDLGRLRVQECERVVALRTELTKCGAKVIEEGDTLTVYPSQLHGAEIETYNDHRMAMCFAVLGLKVPGIKLRNPACVKKTFPNFFQKLAAAPPRGLGVEIRDGHTGRVLGHDELFAD